MDNRKKDLDLDLQLTTKLVETLSFVLKGLPGILPTSKGENKPFPYLFPLPSPCNVVLRFKVPLDKQQTPKFWMEPGRSVDCSVLWICYLKYKSITSQQFCHRLFVLFTTLSRFTFPWVCCLICCTIIIVQKLISLEVCKEGKD